MSRMTSHEIPGILQVPPRLADVGSGHHDNGESRCAAHGACGGHVTSGLVARLVFGTVQVSDAVTWNHVFVEHGVMREA